MAADSLLRSFLNPAKTSLKICGVKSLADAQQLQSLGVPAIGINFWRQSKRYLDPNLAGWLPSLSGSILRVGVFVNANPKHALRLFHEGLIDVIQLHGDESPTDVSAYHKANAPIIKAIGVSSLSDLSHAEDYGAAAILLDAHAPGVYGGTGEKFDWLNAVEFKNSQPSIPVMLAGGIVACNATAAIQTVHPSALDVASGAESSPGVKDFNQVNALLAAIDQAS